jgi:hypothetical protein
VRRSACRIRPSVGGFSLEGFQVFENSPYVEGLALLQQALIAQSLGDLRRELGGDGVY